MSAQILSTGWYSQADKVNYNAYGDDVLRKSDFRPLWWHSVNSYIKPELVFYGGSYGYYQYQYKSTE